MPYRDAIKMALAGHEAMVVTCAEFREICGELVECVNLEFPDLTAAIPRGITGHRAAGNLDRPGGAAGVLAALSDCVKPTPGPAHRERRFPSYIIALGNLAQEEPLYGEWRRVAVAVADLARRGKAAPSTTGERRVLTMAMDILSLHIAVHDDISTRTAEIRVAEALR